MIAPMDRVEIVFLRSELQDITAYLQEQGVLHVESVPLAMENHPGFLHRVHLPEDQKAALEELEELQALVRESVPLLARGATHIEVVEAGQRLDREGLDAWRDNLRQWHRTLRSLTRRKLNIQDNLEVLENYRRILKHVAPTLRERGLSMDSVRILVLQGQTTEAVAELEKRFISDIGPECEFISTPLGRNELVVIVRHPAGKVEGVNQLLKQEEIASVEAPDVALQDVSIDQILDKVTAKLDAYRADLDQIREEVLAFTLEHVGALEAAEQMISTEIAQIGIIDNFAQSQLVGVAHGWVPSDEYDALAAGLQTKFGARVALGKLPMDEVEVTRIPTLLKNRPIFKPFEILLQIYPPATYGHIDPTRLVAISFILFYGFVLGDAGYAMVIGTIAFTVRRKWYHIEMLRHAMTIVLWMAASSFVFGLIYLEIFGDLPYRLIGDYALFHRTGERETMQLLGFVILVGLVHVSLGLALGAWDGYRTHHTKHGHEKMGLLLGLLAIVVALAAGAGHIPGPSSLGYAVAGAMFLAAVVFFWLGMGAMAAMGMMEIIGVSSNVLSYSRLMAISVATFAVADIANALPEMLGFWTGIIFLPLVHMLNIVIGLFSPTIHSLRLNFVEFLPKFYETEGRAYEPFRKEVVW